MKPKDKYHIVYIVLVLHGIGALMAWNMLINADSYFVDYKLNIKNSSSSLDDYRKNFLSYLGIASKAPNILIQTLNMFLNSSYSSLSTRIWSTTLFQAIIFILTIGLAIVDSSEWPEIFFWITMLSAVVINIANGIFQGCVYGIAAKLPMKYTNSVTFGFSISGSIASLFMIISIAIAPNPQEVAIYFFSFAVFYLLFCFVNELLLKRNEFFMFYMENEKKVNGIDLKIPKQKNQISIIDVSKHINKSDSELKGWKRYIFVFKQVWVQLLNLILIYFVSFSIFPSLQANIKPLNHVISDRYFAPVFCFLLFNTFQAVGNFLAQKIRKLGPNYIIIFAFLRFLFIPLFLICNYNPNERQWPVIIQNDWIYIIIAISMALSSGYLSSLSLMYCPQCVKPEYSSTAGMMASLTVILGILAGINSSLLHPMLITL